MGEHGSVTAADLPATDAADRTRRRVAAALTSTWTLGALIALVTWPVRELTEVAGGQDGSWVTALYLATHGRLQFGTEAVWLLGPLGFLEVPRLAYPGLALMSLTYTAIVHVGVSVSALWALRRSFPLLIAAPAALITVALLPIGQNEDKLSLKVLAIAFIWCVAMLRRHEERSGMREWIFPVAAGVACGIEVLVEMNVGMTLLLMSSITAATAFPHRRSRSIALLAGAFAASLLLLWGVAGQGYTALPGYFSYSLEMLSGYASRRAAEAPAGGWHYLALPPLVLLIAATAMWRTRGWPPAALIGTWLITGVVLFAAFKQSFVRHAGGHPPFFFAAAIVLMIGLGLPRGPRRLPVAGAGALGVLLVTLVAVAHSGERRSELRESLQEIGPTRSLSDAAAQVGLLSSPGPAIAQTRKTLRAEYGVDVETVALLRGRGVHIWPDEATLAWAYPEMEWHPLPAFQTAVLYTPKLDRINTEALSTRRGPPFVLRERATRELDGPSTTMALFCHYTQIRSGARWQVLVRGRNRCRRSRRITSVNAISGRPVTVPRAPTARDIVIVRVRGLAPTPLARVQAFLYKGPTWRLAADGTSAGRGGAPFAPRTATGPLIVRVPASVNYPAPFELGVGADKISIVGHPPGARKPERSERRLRVPLTFDFYAVSITGPSVRRP